MKPSMSRFQIHDDLTAPDRSVPVLRGAVATGGQLPNFLGVLAGSPAALRAYARFRSELRHGKLKLATLERISLAVAEYYQSEPGIATHSRTARAAGLALDEVAQARQFNSKDPREAALLRYLKALLDERGRAPARGGARGRLGRRADPGGDRGGFARGVHRDGERRRRGAGRRLK
jgi:alkylhydroperoxidase family enzyme